MFDSASKDKKSLLFATALRPYPKPYNEKVKTWRCLKHSYVSSFGTYSLSESAFQRETRSIFMDDWESETRSEPGSPGPPITLRTRFSILWEWTKATARIWSDPCTNPVIDLLGYTHRWDEPTVIPEDADDEEVELMLEREAELKQMAREGEFGVLLGDYWNKIWPRQRNFYV